MTKETGVNLREKISDTTIANIMEEIEHHPNIANVPKELLKEVVRDAIELENKKENPSLQQVIDHINGQVWSEVFAESARSTAELLKKHLC
jgi:proline dehydrogenase